MITRFPAFALLLVLAGAVAPLRAQTTIAYPNGSTDSTSRSTTGNPLTLQVNATDSATQSGALSGSGSVTKTGGGTLTLSGGNSYTGGTLIDAGTLVAAYNNNESGTFAAGSTVTVNAGATLVANGNDALGWGSGNAKLVVNGGIVTTDAVTGQHTSLQDVTMTGGRITSAASDGHFLLNGPLVTLASAATASIDSPYLELAPGWTSGVVTSFNVARGTTASGLDLSIASRIYGSALLKSGDGTLVLSGTNTYSGGTTVSAGTLQFAQTASLPGTSLTVESGATAAFNVGGAGEFTAADLDVLSALGSATSGFKSGAILGLDPTNADGAFAYASNLANPNSGDNVLGLAKLGSGTLTLSGVNTYTGGTTLAAGTLALGSATALGTSGTISFGGGTLQSSAVNFDDYSARFSNTAGQQYRIDTNGQRVAFATALSSSGGSLTKLGSGILILSRNNTYSGGTTITEGVLQIGNGGTTGSVLGNVSNDGRLVFDRSDDLTFAGEISGSGVLVKSGAGTLTLTGANTYDGSSSASVYVTVIAEGALQVGNGGASGSIAGNVYILTSLIFNRSNDTAYAGVIDGDGSLTKLGAGNLTLSGANPFTGGTAINAGSLTMGDATALGSGNVTLAEGATLDSAAYGFNLTRLSGAGSLTGSGPYTYDAAGDATLTSLLAGSASLTKSGPGALTLSGASTYSGGTAIDAGTLTMGNATALGSGNVSLAAGTTLDTAAYGFDLTRASGVGTLTGSGAFTFSAAGNTTLASLLAGSASLTKSGAGTLTLTGANTYGGGTAINAGSLTMGHATALGSGNVTLASGTTLNSAAYGFDLTRLAGPGSLTGSGPYTYDAAGDATLASLLAGSASLTKSGPGALTLSGASTYSGGTAINAGSLTMGNATALGSGNVSLAAGTTLDTAAYGFDLTRVSGAGTLTGSGAYTFSAAGNSTFTPSLTGTASLTKSGAGTLTLTGANTYGGGTTLNSGTLSVSRIGDLVFGGGTLRYTGANDSSERNFTINANQVATIDITANTLTFTGASVATNGALTKTGAGTLILTGANLHTGTTTINAGTLVLSGGDNRLSSTTNVSLNNGATLDLDGNFQSVHGLGTVIKPVVGNITAGTIFNHRETYLRSGTFDNNFAGNSTSSRLWLGGGTDTITLNGDNDSVYYPDHNQVIIGVKNPSYGLPNPIGTVRLGGTNSLAAATENVYVYSGILDLNGQTAVRALSIHLADGNASSLINDNTSTDASFNSDVIAAPDFRQTVVGLARIGGAGHLTLGGVISGIGLNKIGAGVLTLGAANTYSGPTTITAGTLRLSGNGRLNDDTAVTVGLGATFDLNHVTHTIGSLAGSGTATLGSAVLTAGGNDTSTVFAGVISGTGALTKTGAGTLTLSGTNTYTGGTTITAGTLQIGAGGANGSTSGPIVNNASLAFNRSDNFTYLGAISGAGGLTQSGTGTLTLSSRNAYTGTTTVSAGNLIFANRGAYYSDTLDATTAAKLSIANGATASFGVGDGGYFSTADLGTILTHASFVNGATLGIDTTNATGGAFTWANAVTGTLGLTKVGTGTLTLSGNNNYTGPTTISGGTLALAGWTAGLSAATSVDLTHGATLDLGGTTQTIAGLGTFASGVVGNITAGTINTEGDIVLQSGVFNSDFASTSDHGRLWIGGDSAATVTLNGINDRVFTADHHQVVIGFSYTGAAGTVRIGNANALAAATEEVHLYAGTLDLNGREDVRAAALVLQSGSASALINGSTTAPANFDHAVVLHAADSVIGGVGNLSLGGSVGGGGGFAKIGAGTLELAGANTYTGATRVNAGQLTVNGSIAASSLTTVNPGATLGGSGTVGALTITSGGLLSPGNSPGTLTAGNTLFEGGGTFVFEVNDAAAGPLAAGTNYDLLSISGVLAITATSGNRFVLDLTSLKLSDNTAGLAANFDPAADYSFTFLTTTGGITGFAADAFAIDTTDFQNPYTGTWSVSLTHSGHDLTLDYAGAGASAVPEPSTYAALAGIAALAIAAWRRRPVILLAAAGEAKAARK